jgi:hypothetical protein
MQYNFKEWIHAAGIRAIKTVAQTALGLMSSAVILGDVDWVLVLSASAMAGIYSLLTSIVGLPELDKKHIE